MYYEIIKNDSVNNYYLFSDTELLNLKHNISQKKLKQFELDMQTLFEYPFVSVCDKNGYSPSIDKHDYVSLGSYWWVNPDTIDGLPYIRRDGEVNPEGNNYDKQKFKRLAYLVYHAGLLYFLTEDKKYYELLKKHCYFFFIDKNTKMNPHLNYGQFIPGVISGRAEGIIDYSANFAYALHILTKLANFNLIDSSFLEGMIIWHTSFKEWLLTSDIGKDEQNKENNHGIFYDFALLIINLFIHDTHDLQKNVELFVENRILKQIAMDGSLPQEIVRTRSKNYSFMALKGMMDYIKLAEAYDIFILVPEIKTCIDWIFHYEIFRKEKWPYQQITFFDESTYIYFMIEASNIYGSDYFVNELIQFDNILNKVPYYLFIN